MLRARTHRSLGAGLIAVLALAACCDSINDEDASETSSLAVEAPELPDELRRALERPTSSLAAAFVGCNEVRRGPVCLIDDDVELRVWVPVLAREDVELQLDGQRADLTPTPSEDGLLWRFNLTGAHTRLTLDARTVTGPASFELQLARVDDESYAETRPPALQEAQAFIAEQRYDKDAAQAHIERLDALLPTLSDEARAFALGRLARLHYRRDEPERALERYQQSTMLATRLGLTSRVREDALAAAYITTYIRPDHAAAHRWLDLESTAAAGDPSNAAYAAYLRGLLAVRVGEYELALRQYREAAYLARRLALETDERDVLQMWGVLLSELGRHEEARSRFARAAELTGDETPACARAELLTNTALSNMRAREAGAPADDPRPLLLEVIELNAPGGACGNQESADRARLNLAQEALGRDDLAAARAALGHAVDAELANSSERRRRLELLARLALQEGRPRDSLARWDEFTSEADADADLDRLRPADRWSRAFWRARALEAIGETEAALTAYARAEAELDAQLLDVAYDEGRESVALDHHRGARHYIDLLVREGRGEDALCAARLARARTTYPIDRGGRLAALSPEARRTWDERVQAYRRARARLDRARQDDWRLSSAELSRALARRRVETTRAQELRNEALGLLSKAQAAPVRCQDLRPPGPGELLLMYHPVAEGWVGFAATTHEVIVARVARSSDELEATLAQARIDPGSGALRDRLLTPFAAQLNQAERVRVLPLGTLLDVPFHALPWPSPDGAREEDPVEDDPLRVGEPLLLDHAPVAYAVDLPRPPALEPRELETPPRHAVVLGDPRSNLEHVLNEISEVDSILDDRRWSVELLHDADADSDTLRSAIARAAHLHYAGHGLSDGLAGAGSFVELADTQLSVGDILVLPRVPRSVVLAGCETGLTNTHTLAGGMSVARAFLAAGSESVIAADHEIDDEVAATISVELYTALAEGDPFDGPAILRRAQRAMRSSTSETSGWSDLRAWIP